MRWGYNRDKETLPQINLLLLNGMENHMHSATAMEERIFIQFILLLITTRLKQVMNEAGWFKNYDLQEMLNGMKTVRTVNIQGNRKKYTTELTQFQKKIFELYHLTD